MTLFNKVTRIVHSGDYLISCCYIDCVDFSTISNVIQIFAPGTAKSLLSFPFENGNRGL